MKPVWYGSRVLIEKDDADHFTIGENVTFINWGNLIVKSINKFVVAYFLPFLACHRIHKDDICHLTKIYADFIEQFKLFISGRVLLLFTCSMFNVLVGIYDKNTVPSKSLFCLKNHHRPQ